ncbi:MAG TPA: hypothetical protein VFB29_12665 [Pseudolabrys sp.]|nr:hypothetical protein [Pseudolabrys sp.]
MAISRIAQACSWAGPKIQVVVRDNSGNADKRALLERFRGEYVEIVSVDPCEPPENFAQTLRLARGDFIFSISDDDQCIDRAIHALPDAIDRSCGDPTVAAVTGTYALEVPQGTSIVAYKDVDSDDPVARVAGYLSYGGPNMLHYSVLRRQIAERVLAFMLSMPVYLSFHDQVLCLLYLLSGKYIKLPRLFYIYEVGVWGSAATAQERDIEFYTAAGLDPAANKFHWLLCGFEGAALIMNSAELPAYPTAQRQRIADLWFTAMFNRFRRDSRVTCDSPFTGEAEKLCAKLAGATGQLTFERVLADISGFFGLFSKDRAQGYFEFWDSVLNRRRPFAPAAAAAGKR